MTPCMDIFVLALYLGCCVGGFVGGCSGLTTGAVIAAMRGRDALRIIIGALLSAFCGMGVGVVAAIVYAILAAILAQPWGKGFRFAAWLEIPLETAAVVLVCILSAFYASRVVEGTRAWGCEPGRHQTRAAADANNQQ
jgi:hypothetical protein